MIKLITILRNNHVSFRLMQLFVFSLPLYRKLLPVIIFLWLLAWLAEGNFIERFRNKKHYLLFAACLMFYIVHLTGMIYTSNTDSGLFDLEVKSAMFLLPILIFGYSCPGNTNIKQIFIAFTAGNLLASLFCLSRAISLFICYDNLYFTYDRLSFFLHPSYFSLYLTFNIIILFYFISNDIFGFSKKWKLIFFSFIVYFCLMVFLLSSRAGIICCFVSLFLMILFDVIKSRRFTSGIAYLLVIAVFSFLALKYNSRFQNATEVLQSHQHGEKTINNSVQTSESIGVRIIIWQLVIELVKDNPVLGTGTGDVKDELMKNYSFRGMKGAFDQKLNVHNQFLETLFGLGITGFIPLLLMFALSFVHSIRKNNLILLFFLFATGFNFLFESMLNTQAGVLFFAFFFSFLNFASHEPESQFAFSK